MTRTTLLLLVCCAPAMTACVPMMAASAVSMAAEGAQGSAVSNQALQPQASDACTAHAAQYGSVNIIDVEQHAVDKIIVWGTVGEGTAKRSFECDYKTTITGFKLRDIHTER